MIFKTLHMTSLLVLALGAAFTFQAAAQSTIPAPVVSLKADSIPNATSGMAVTDWPNVGSGMSTFDAKSSPDTAPHLVAGGLNSLPVVHFDASRHQYLSLKRPVQDDFTIFCVFRSTQGIGDGPAFFGGAGLVQGEVPGVVSDFGMSLNAAGQVAAGSGLPDVSFASAKGFNDGKPHIAVMSRAKSTGLVTLYVDGTLAGTVKGGTQSLVAPEHLGIGALMNNGQNLGGDIAEIDIYDLALSADQVQSEDSSLKAKWGIP